MTDQPARIAQMEQRKELSDELRDPLTATYDCNCVRCRAAKEIELLESQLAEAVQALDRSDAKLKDLISLEASYRASERAMLQQLSDVLTNGNAGQWEEILRAAQASEAAREVAHEAAVRTLQRCLPTGEHNGYCFCNGPDTIARHLDTCPARIFELFTAAMRELK